ncbi:histidine kinase [Aurantiacibacter spongiae]|uniref:histidine kinase n=2 Tax=Aurantiacibacter spongiae TaxID=2488860 RepID=A0A3N5CU76_9SPHN|nr:histidine kinase [Aurantiacibacter spongiae]
MPLGIFALIFGITLLSMYAIERGQAQREEAQLNARATAIAGALERRANASSAYLRAGAALLSTMQTVPADDFRRFVSELRLDADYRGAEGIGWAKVVLPGEIDEFDAMMEAQRPNVHLNPRPDGSQPFAVPVTYLQPDTERNRRALGFDMYSETTRREAMIEAERTSRPTATGRVVLQQEGSGEAPGFLIYMPVFEPAGGGRVLKGFIYSPFNAQDFLQSALELEDAGAYGVRLYDEGENGRQLLAGTFDGDMNDREGIIKTVTIANNPSKLVISKKSSGGLSGLSMATLIFGLLVASLLMLLVQMLTQQAQEDEASLAWFEEQASIRNSLTRELNHRVKNTLANVLSIIALTRRRADNVEEFANGLDGRVRALSATHDLLTQSDWGSTPVRAVIDAELLPYADDSEHHVDMRGPDVELAPNDALSLGLATHELATNAAKYGALSTPGGEVKVHWKLVSEALVRVEWLERGGPPVKTKRTRGFGMDLIERIVAHELKNPVELDFEEEGVRCVLLIPVRRATEFLIRANRPEPSARPAPSGK